MGLTKDLGALPRAITVSNSNNVGVGVAIPQERFEVAGLTGNIRIYGRSGIAQNQISSNVYYNGSAWVRDTSSGAVAINLDANNGSLSFFTTATTSGFPDERMRIFSNGNVFIGPSPSDAGFRLDINGTGRFLGTLQSYSITIRDGGNNGQGTLNLGSTNGYFIQGGADYTAINFYTNATERMRITSGGNVLIGTTDTGFYGRINSIATTTSAVFLTSNGTSNVIDVWANSGGGNNPFVGFITDGGVQRGNIDYNRGANVVRYNTSSDANLKNIIGDSDKQKSVDILNSTKIREYSWKDDETNKSQIGVIAQELYATFKGAVSKGSDDEDFGNEDYKNWGVDKTAFTFHLIAGWQEHERLIQELTARLEILENK
jgi:hypothetical protein